MSENSNNKNSGLRQALESKKNKALLNGFANQKAPKPNKGFGGATVMRRSGRGR
jgi:hypothetical protein